MDGNKVVDISTKLIHEVIGLSNQGSSPLNEKNVKNVIENTKSTNNDICIVITQIKQDDVRFLSKIISTKFYSNSREDDLIARFMHTTYKLCVEKTQVIKLM